MKNIILPERWSVPRPIWKDVRQPYGDPLNKSDIEAAGKFNLALDEVARLNSSPVSVGAQPVVSYQDDPRSPSELSLSGCRCVRFGEGNPHWPCKLHPPVSAVCDTCHGEGEVWTGENQSFGYMSMQPPEPIMEACPECSGESASDGRSAFAEYLKDCEVHGLEPDIGGAFHFAWQARAALSAPSHGGGVAHTDCRSEDGITVGLIDSIITSCRVLSSRDLTCEAAVEALRDLRSDSDVSLIKPIHGEQVREGFLLARETVLELPGGSKELGYTPMPGLGVFVSNDEVFAAIRELGLPLGWVSVRLGQVIAAAPSAGSQKEQGE